MKAGEEITISYGLMPPDMAFYHYGYLPTFGANDTIPLFAMDHREWDNSHQPGAYNYTDITCGWQAAAGLAASVLMSSTGLARVALCARGCVAGPGV